MMWIQRLFIITIMVFIIQGWIYKKWGIKNIFYKRDFNTSAVFVGDEVEMVEQIVNMKLLPVPWLRVESKIDACLQFQKQANLDIKHGEYHKSLFSLMPYMKITRRHKIRCTQRGCYNLKSVTMTCGDLFGCSDDQRRTLEIDAKLLVYPTLIPIEDIPLPAHSWQGDIVVKRWIVEDPFMIAGTREYHYGDSMNQIDWKATARCGSFQVHKYDFTADSRLMIWLNVDVSEEQWTYTVDTETIEKGISYAASISQYAISHGIETGFGSNGFVQDNENDRVFIPARCSHAHLVTLFETMAKLVCLRRISFHTFLEECIAIEDTNIDILLITAFVSEKMQEQISRLKAQGNGVQILWLEGEQNADD